MALAALGFSLAALSVAWACTQDASMRVSNYNPMPGEVIHATGVDYYAGANVELRWGSQTGPVLATTQTTEEPGREFVEDGSARGTFAVDVAIPADATPGDHILYAISPGARIAPVRLTIPGETAPEVPDQDPEPAPADEDPQPAPAAEDPQPAPALTGAPASESPVAFTPPPGAEEPVSAGATQPVAGEPAPAAATQPVAGEPVSEPAPVRESAPAPVVNTDWRSTHGALLHAVPDSLQDSDDGAFADAVAASREDGYAWTDGRQGRGPVGIGAGLALFAPGLMLLFGGFTVAAVARRRERVEMTHR